MFEYTYISHLYFSIYIDWKHEFTWTCPTPINTTRFILVSSFSTFVTSFAISHLCHYHPYPAFTSLGSDSPPSWATLPGRHPRPARLWCSPADNPSRFPSHLSAWNVTILCRDPTRLLVSNIAPYGTWTYHVMLPCHGDASIQNEPPWSPCPGTYTFLTWPYLMAWVLNCLGREEVSF